MPAMAQLSTPQQLFLFQLINQMKSQYTDCEDVLNLLTQVARLMYEERQRTENLDRELQLQQGTRQKHELEIGDEKMHNLELKRALKRQAKECTLIIRNLQHATPGVEGLKREMEELREQQHHILEELRYEKYERNNAERELELIKNQLHRPKMISHIEKLHQMLEAVKGRSERLKTDLDNEIYGRDNAEKELEVLKNELEEQKEIVNSKCNKTEELQHMLEAEKDESKRLREDLDSEKYGRNNVEEELEISKNELERLKKHIEGTSNHTEELQQMLEIEKDKAKRMNEYLDNEKYERYNAEKELEILRSKLKRQEENMEGACNRSRQMLAEEKENAKQLKEDLDNEKYGRDNAEKKLKVLTNELEKQKENYRNCSHTEELQEMLGAQKGKTIRLKEDLDNERKRNTEVMARTDKEIKNMTEIIKELENKLSNSTMDAERAERNLSDEKRKSEDLQRMIDKNEEVCGLSEAVKYQSNDTILSDNKVVNELKYKLQKEKTLCQDKVFLQEENILKLENNIENCQNELKMERVKGVNITKHQNCCKDKENTEIFLTTCREEKRDHEKQCLEKLKKKAEELESDVEMIKRLAVECTDEYGNTPLHKAAENCQIEEVKALLEHGASGATMTFSEWGNTPIHKAAIVGCVGALELLIHDKEAANLLSRDNYTPLILAVQKGHSDVVRFLLEHGANASVRTQQRKTPLHFAAEKGDVVVTKLLVEGGADPNGDSEAKYTPLHSAAYGGHLEVVKLLVEHGANITTKNERGKIPRENAEDTSHSDVAKWLKEQEEAFNVTEM